MADRYWVGGTSITSLWTSGFQGPWRATPGASFSGTQVGTGGTNTNIVTFTNLKGPIANGHTIYVSGTTATINSAITFSNPEQTAGSFTVNTFRNLSTRGMYAHALNTTVTAPGTSDTVYFDAGSAYSSADRIRQVDPTTINKLNMDGFRGRIVLGKNNAGSITYGLTVNTDITWPSNDVATSIEEAYITLTSTSVLYNNGWTTVDGPLSYVYYRVSGFTPPVNIIARGLQLIGAVNLSNRTIIADRIVATATCVLTPGTSTLITGSYTTDAGSTANTLYNVEILNYSGLNYVASVTGTLTYNSLSIKNAEGTVGYAIIGDTTLTNLNMQSPDSPSSQNFFIDGGGGGSTITKTGGNSVMLQVGGVYGCEFQPPNTFFSVGADFTDPIIGYGNLNIRPSPSPLNFL